MLRDLAYRPLVACLVLMTLATAFPPLAEAQEAQETQETLPSRAAPPDAETIARARSHFNAGTAYYEDGRYEDAAREFDETYRLTQHPDVLFNLASTYDRLERRDEAIAHYRRYLDEAASPADRDRIERRIRELETLRDAERDAADSARADRTRVATTQGDDEGPSLLAPIGWSLAGLGVAAGIVAVITGVMAQRDYDQLTNACAVAPPHTCIGFDADGIKSEGQTMATLNTVFLITGIVALAGGATLLVLDLSGSDDDDERPAPDATRARLEITPGPGSFGAGARLSF